MIMKQPGKLFAFLFTAVVFAACQKEIRPPQSQEMTPDELTESDGHHGHGYGNDKDGGYVYTLSNQTDANKVLVYRRGTDGKIEFLDDYYAGGKGTGGGLGNQGALAITGDGDMLLAVNAASNSISSFKIDGKKLHLASVVHSGGIMPVSITEYHKLVYVLNAGGDGNITGFRLDNNGKLYPVYHSRRRLSSNAAGAAQISFVNDGRALAITEKATNKIISYTLDYSGKPRSFHSITSANATPFGFAVGDHGILLVSEAAGGAPGASTLSSYRVNYNGAISLIDGPVSANQTAACWVVLTDNGKYTYATNTGSNNVSSFKVGYSGNLDVLSANAGDSGMTPIDAALSGKSKYLYVLNSGDHSISVYSVGYSGGLDNIQTVAGVPLGATGLAAD
jgi:6-phosphogluconolactonase